MSRSRSFSLEIVPPKVSREIVTPSHKDLAAVMDAVFKSNSKQNRDDGKRLEDAETSNTLSPAATGFPPNPCERCVRTKKTCKGVAGARCEYCKRLKQKCSNSTGPARGKHAVPKQPKAHVASPSKPVPSSAGGSDSAKWQDRPKRKVPEKLSVSQNGDGEESDDDEDEHEVQQNANKKRRLSKSTSRPEPSRTLLAKAVADMDASIKRVESSVAKEVEKMKGIMKNLNAKIKEMDED
jgi:hypothetical protein